VESAGQNGSLSTSHWKQLHALTAKCWFVSVWIELSDEVPSGILVISERNRYPFSTNGGSISSCLVDKRRSARPSPTESSVS
jgi:hypothetical protein